MQKKLQHNIFDMDQCAIYAIGSIWISFSNLQDKELGTKVSVSVLEQIIMAIWILGRGRGTEEQLGDKKRLYGQK